MTSWFKNLYMSPFHYGLNQLNNVVMNALTIFLNNYGNKLFKIETEIIKETECIDNMDVFHLYPIYIENHVSQLINFNLITFNAGIIDGITISFPWKTLLSTLTIVKITSIDLTISIEKKLPVVLSKSIYDMDTETDADLTNQDLTIAYEEISGIIQQYFKSIRVEIESIKIKIENLCANLENIIYCDKIISIGKIQIRSNTIPLVTLTGEPANQIRNVEYNILQSTMHIAHISINTAYIIECLPQIYLSDDPPNDISNEEITIHIDELDIDNIQIRNFKFTIKAHMITILNLNEVIIPNIIKIYTKLGNLAVKNNFLLSYDKLKSVINFGSAIYICLFDLNKLEEQFSYLNNLFNLISNKIITQQNNNNNDKKLLTIENAQIILGFKENSVFDIKFDEMIYLDDISTSKIISISELKILDIDNNVYTEIVNVNIDLNFAQKNNDEISDVLKLELHNLNTKTNLFSMISKNILITKSNNELEFIFTDTYSTEIILLVNYVKHIIELCKEHDSDSDFIDPNLSSSRGGSNDSHYVPVESKKPLLLSTISSKSDIDNSSLSIIIHAKNSGFSIIHKKEIIENLTSEYNFNFEIKSGCIYVTDKIGTKIDLNISMNDNHISTLFIDCIDSESIDINDCKFFLDPNMFDQLNYLFGTLIPENNADEVKKSQLVMSQSMMANSVDEFELVVNTAIAESIDESIDDFYIIGEQDQPVIKLLLNSISDLHNVVINSYCAIDNNKYDIKIHIKAVSIYLFDQISSNINTELRNAKSHSVGRTSTEVDLRNDKSYSVRHSKETELKNNKSHSVRYSKETELKNNKSHFVDRTLNEPEQLKEIILTDSFLCVILNEINANKLSVTDSKTLSKNIKYTCKISKGYAIDMSSSDTRWKYFFKSANDDNLLNGIISTHDDLYKIKIDIGSLIANIREETLLRLLGFFSNSHQLPTSMKKNGSKSTAFIEIFNISEVNVLVNFFPLILKNNNSYANMLSLKDFKIKLRHQHFENIDGFDIIISKITTAWTSDINLDNILQFVPNINIIQPYTSGFAQIIKLINKYFENDYNRKKLREITKHISSGIDFVTYFVKMGYDQVINFFEASISVTDIKTYISTITKYEG